MTNIADAASMAAEQAREYILRVIEEMGTDATNLARRARINPSTITGFISPNPRQRSIRPSTLEAIARVSSIPLPPSLRVDMPAPPQAAPAGEAMPRDVPIHGLMTCPVRDAYYWNPAHLDFAPRPWGIQHNKRVFALRMPDETMDGWRRVNELIYVDPARAVADGDHAMIEMPNENAPNEPSVYVIRRVVRRRAATVTLGTWGLDPGTIDVDRIRILSFRRILEWPEVVGV